MAYFKHKESKVEISYEGNTMLTDCVLKSNVSMLEEAKGPKFITNNNEPLARSFKRSKNILE